MTASDWACAIVFWLSGAAVVYAYVGYPVLVTLFARFIRSPVPRAPITPAVTFIIPAYNEEAVIAEKLENTFALDYPREQLEIIVVADGSTDGTCEIARRYSACGVRLAHQSERRGKIAAMNRAVSFARGDILVFSDANAMLEPQALGALVANFADARVACAGGEKRIRRAGSLQARGEGAYWRYEAYLKRLDSEINSAIGAVGELYAIRRELFQPLDVDLIIEDFVMTVRLVALGWRVVYEPRAITWEDATPSLRGEWNRRARNAAGCFQALVRLARMQTPLRGLAAWQFVSHKVMRWLAPFFMIAAFVANGALLGWPFYRLTMAAQAAFYLLALVGYASHRLGARWWLLQTPFYFCFANATSLAGFFRFATRSQTVMWTKSR